MLALRANRTVAADELIDGLWADRPPASAAKNLQSYVSELRKALASDGAGASIVTRGRGYELRVAEEAVDALRFEDLVEEAARQPTGAGANGLAGAALELWRGAPLADVASEPFAAPEIGRLEELHMRAIELAIDAELAAGRHAEVVARLEALIAEEPLRERSARAAHARPLSRRAPVGGARGLPRGARGADRADRGRAGPRAQAPAGADPRPGPGPRGAAADRRAAGPARGGLAAARRTRARARLAAQALGAGARGPDCLRDGLGAGGDRQDTAAWASSRPRSSKRAPRSSMPAVARSPRRRWRP